MGIRTTPAHVPPGQVTRTVRDHRRGATLYSKSPSSLRCVALPPVSQDFNPLELCQRLTICRFNVLELTVVLSGFRCPSLPLQDFNPLELCQRLAPLLEKLPELSAAQLSATAPVRAVALDKYVPALKQAAVLRLLKQLSEVYR